MPLNYSSEMLSSVSKLKKAAMCLVGKMAVLDKLYAGTSSSASGQEGSDTERTSCTK